MQLVPREEVHEADLLATPNCMGAALSDPRPHFLLVELPRNAGIGDTSVTDRLVLRTVVGAEPYLAEDITDRTGLAPRDVHLGIGYVEFEYSGPLANVGASRLFSSCGPVLAAWDSSEPLDEAPLITRITESLEGGLLAAIAGSKGSPVRFRVADLGERRWQVRDAVVKELGWINDPGDWDVNLELVGEFLVAEVGLLHYSNRIAALARQEVSTTPVVAAVLCRLAKLDQSDRVLDPFCGSGTILFEASHWCPRAVMGSDISASSIAVATRNLTSATGSVFVAQADRSPVRPASIDRIVSNLPFGKQVGSHANNKHLYPALLSEMERVLVPDGRAVVLTEDKRLLRESVERSDLKILRERVLESGGARPTAFVLGFKRSRRGGKQARRPGPP